MAQYKETETGLHKKGLLGGIFSGGFKMGLFGFLAASVAVLATGGLALPFLIPAALAAGAAAGTLTGGAGAAYSAARWAKESLFNAVLGRPRLREKNIAVVNGGRFDGEGREARESNGLGGLFAAGGLGMVMDFFNNRSEKKEAKREEREEKVADKEAAREAAIERRKGLNLDNIHAEVEFSAEELASPRSVKEKLAEAERDIRQAYANDVAAARGGDDKAAERVADFDRATQENIDDPSIAAVSVDGGVAVKTAALVSKALTSEIGGVLDILSSSHRKSLDSAGRDADRAQTVHGRVEEKFIDGRASSDDLNLAAGKAGDAKSKLAEVAAGADVKELIGGMLYAGAVMKEGKGSASAPSAAGPRVRE